MTTTIPMRSATPAPLWEKLEHEVLLALSEEKDRVSKKKAEVQSKRDLAQAEYDAAWNAAMKGSGEFSHAAYLEGALKVRENDCQYCAGQESEVELLTKFITAAIDSFKAVYTAELTRELDPWEVPA